MNVRFSATVPLFVEPLVEGFSDYAAFTFLALLLVLNTAALAKAAEREGPCDILMRAGTPCVAAHSTTRALYAATDGVARAGQPETMFLVTSGLHANRGCCFDYGNAETNNRDMGSGHMDALNISFICHPRRSCLGPGP